MKLAKEVGKDLRTLPSACRSAAIRLLELGFDIVDVKQNLVKFAELESKLYDRWYRKWYGRFTIGASTRKPTLTSWLTVWMKIRFAGTCHNFG